MVLILINNIYSICIISISFDYIRRWERYLFSGYKKTPR